MADKIDLEVTTSASTEKTTEKKHPRAPRTKAAVNKTTPPPTPTPAPTTTSVPPVVDEDYETVDLDDPDPEHLHVDPNELIASEVSAIVNSGDFQLTGSPEYIIDEASLSYEKKDGDTTGQYPLYVWARDPTTLAGYYANSVSRINNDVGTDHDYRLCDIAEDNRITWDSTANAFFAKTNADWRNHLLVNGRKLRHGKVGINNDGKREISSSRQETFLFDRLGLGIPLIVRLWHTGVSFTINPLTKEEAVGITEKLRNAHLETLRKTSGLVHGISTYYANRIVVTEFMRRVTGSNIDKGMYPNILALMDHRDIQSMAWGLFSSFHPKGFRLIEQCGGVKTVTGDDNVPVLKADGTVRKSPCTHREDIIADPNLIYTINNNMFTEWQRDMISRPVSNKTGITEADILRYRTEGDMHVEDSLCVDEEQQIFVMVKAPLADAHIEIGEEWINSIEDALNDAITINADDDTKNAFIENKIQAAASLDVVHWVTGFVIDGVEIRDRQAIVNTFRGLSNNPVMQVKIFDTVRKGIIHRLGCMYAIPTKKCPECGTLSNTVATNGTAIYTPIDMVARFFTQIARNQ